MLDRRQFLRGGLAAAAWGLAGGWPLSGLAKPGPRVRELTLIAGVTPVDLGGGGSFLAWTYNGRLPGPEIRLRQGDILRVRLKNHLPEPTTVHWHGLAVPNLMDGVAGLTQKPVPPGGEFLYEFPVTQAGTYFYHSHRGLQLDRGLYGPLIVEPAAAEVRPPDREYVLMLEDWARVDGGGPNSPRRRPPGMMMGGMMGGMGRGGGGDEPPLEPVYDAFAVNGRAYPHGPALAVRQGERVRLRLINASAVSIYDLSLAGHPLVITHTDGRPVRPQTTQVLRLAPGERYDVEFLADNPGRWLLASNNLGWGENGLRVEVAYQGVRRAEPVPPLFRPGLSYATVWDLRAARPQPPRAGRGRGREYRQVLSGGMHSAWWTINGQVWPRADYLFAPIDTRVRLKYLNRSMMPHPMHLHGHSFRVVNPALEPAWWVTKDTLLVERGGGAAVDFLADNPGFWFHHCHNLYHMEAGMAGAVEVSA
ncbi:MAG: multicopper oxidase family protein [Deltaproteobacteria bacterium]|nr:multicopper oxidase family protein [Deltaproteobacteria bacterium]